MTNSNQRHLSAVPDQADNRLRLTPSAALDLERAEEFLLALEDEWNAGGVTCARMSYMLGVCETHLADVIGILRAVVRP